MWNGLRAILGLFLVVPGSVWTAETLSVGEGVNQRSWLEVRNSANRVAVASDSIWTWPVDSNLATSSAGRGGGMLWEETVLVDGDLVTRTHRLVAGDLLADGDEGTFFNPDESVIVERSTPLILDLGGAFRINRLRFHPRLDRENRRRFLQQFSIQTSPGGLDSLSSLISFPSHDPNVEPVVDREFESRDVRLIRLAPSIDREWEIAELQVFGDGSVPVGEYVSRVLRARATNIVWGKVRYDAGPVSDLPGILQTRTGTDRDPLLFFQSSVAGLERFIQVEESVYRGLEEEERGPIRHNSNWTGWDTVTDDLISSPPRYSYLQFRLFLPVPGVVLRNLHFDYILPPIAADLAAEIFPSVVESGADTEFTLSMQIHLNTGGSTPDTGFRQLQVRTDADIVSVDRFLLDDRVQRVTATVDTGRGFTLALRRQLRQSGSFVQIGFTGRVFRDRTRFELAAVDRRTTDEGEVDEVFQIARAADIDADLPGGTLVVQVETEDGRLPLITDMQVPSPLFSPNGDGVHDEFVLEYSLLKLMTPARVTVSVFDLSGRLRRRIYGGEDVNGRYDRSWDGRDEGGRLLPPGLYIYQVEVDSDYARERRQGVVGVVY